MRYYSTFSGDFYHDTTQRIVEDAPKFGADKVLVYDDYWLTHCRPDFYRQNEWAWKHHATRGFGWFIWKPFLMLDALSRVNDGDIVLFTDADTYPIQPLNVLYDICAAQGGVMLFDAATCWHRHWCKRDCFIIMGQDEPRYNGAQVQHAVARFFLFQKGPWLVNQFLMEWLAYVVNPLCNTFDKSIYAPEYGEFKEHRCEQAVLTNLAHKYGHKLWREACQYGNQVAYDFDAYPQLFVQEGAHSSGPVRGQGSCFRNVND